MPSISIGITDGQQIGNYYRTAIDTGKSLDGLPLWAIARPCGIKTASIGCCGLSMPTTLTVTLYPATNIPAGIDEGSPQVYTVTWGNWWGGSLYFWQYIIDPGDIAALPMYTATEINVFCYPSWGPHLSMQTFVTLKVPIGVGGAYNLWQYGAGPSNTLCCSSAYTLTDGFRWAARFADPYIGNHPYVTSGSTWEVLVTHPCGSGSAYADQDYWPALDTGKTLDSLPLWAAADCISDNGVSSGSTNHPFQPMSDVLARAFYRFAVPTGRILDGLPMFAAENDPCCDGGGLNPGYGSNVTVSCWTTVVPTRLYLTVTQLPKIPAWPVPPPPFTVELNFSTDPNAGYLGNGYAGYSYLICTTDFTYSTGFWWGTIGETNFYLFPCYTSGLWMLTNAPCYDSAKCTIMGGAGGGPLYLTNIYSEYIGNICVPGYDGFGRFIIVVTE